MSPFPVYDTDYVNKVKDVINKMENSKKNYDNLPVTACSHCKSLHIVVDEDSNDICEKCGSVNEIKVYDNIDHWIEFNGHIWEQA